MGTLKCKLDAPETYLMLTFENRVEIGLNETESNAQGMIALSGPSTVVRRIGEFAVHKMQDKLLVYCRNTANTLEINFRNPKQPSVLPWPENVTMEIISGGVNRGRRTVPSVSVLRISRNQIETEELKADPTKGGNGQNVKPDPAPNPKPSGTKPVQDAAAQTIADQKQQIDTLKRQVDAEQKKNQQLTESIRQARAQEKTTFDGLTAEQEGLLRDLTGLKEKNAGLQEDVRKTAAQCRDLKTDVRMAGDLLEKNRKEQAELEKELEKNRGDAAAVETYITEQRRKAMARQNLLDFDEDALKKAVEDDLRHLETDSVAARFLASDGVLYSSTVEELVREAEEKLRQADEQLSRLIHLREAIDLRILETIQAGDGKMDAGKEAGYGISASDTANHDKTAAGD